MMNLKTLSCAIILFLCFAFQPGNKKKVLVIGDSISIGYFPFVKSTLADVAVVMHNEGNAQHTGTGIANIKSYIGNGHWDVIHFNWGLWDLCYRNPASANQGHRDKLGGKVEYTLVQYEKNMDTLVAILKQSGAKLIFATTTVVPPNESGRIEGDEKKYNEVALKIMRKHNVSVNDLGAASYAIHEKHSAGDGNVHYTPEGYRQLADAVAKSIKKVLGN